MLGGDFGGSIFGLPASYPLGFQDHRVKPCFCEKVGN